MMQKLFNLMFIIFLLVLIGLNNCSRDASSEVQRNTLETIKDLQKYMVFMRHKKSNLCFAVMNNYHNGYLAHVPCNQIPTNLLEE